MNQLVLGLCVLGLLTTAAALADAAGPIETYPRLAERLRAEAVKHLAVLRPGRSLSLNGRSGVLASGFGTDTLATGAATVNIPADGLLAFAVEASQAMYVSGSVELEPDADLRPGLRVTVLCDDTVIAAPMVRFAPGWEGEGNNLTGPAPVCTGDRPSSRVELTPWLMPQGRHTILIAGPHFRPGGTFTRLRLRPLDRPVQEPLYQFAQMSDLHIGDDDWVWVNRMMCRSVRAQLPATLADLRAEDTRFVIMTGDMTNVSEREQYESLGRICAASGLQVYGCIGNHDGYQTWSRPAAMEFCPGLFPGQKTDYAFTAGGLRFVVMDGSYWRQADGTIVDFLGPGAPEDVTWRPEQLQWLCETLTAHPTTPTIFIWHYPLHARCDLTSCGYRLPNMAVGDEVLEVLAAAPNVRAVLSGHTHWNEVNQLGRQQHIVTPSLAEWPNAYRVFRVYPDRVEWELRQVRNRGFVRESFVPEKALSWAISTKEGDLGGSFGLRDH